MKRSTLALIVLTAVGIATFFLTQEKRLLRSVLQIDSLPSGTKVLDRATWSWTDYREEYFISFRGDHMELLSGRKWEECHAPPGSSIDFSAGLRAHTPATLTSCLTSGGSHLSEGLVRIALNRTKTVAVIIYDVD